MKATLFSLVLLSACASAPPPTRSAVSLGALEGTCQGAYAIALDVCDGNAECRYSAAVDYRICARGVADEGRGL